MDQIDPKLIEYIDKLAKAVGTTSEYLWGVLVKQGYLVLGRQLLYLLVIWPLILFFSIRSIKGEVMRARMVHEKYCAEHDWYSSAQPVKYQTGIFVGMGFAIGFSSIVAFIIFFGIATPEMYALQRLMEIFK